MRAGAQTIGDSIEVPGTMSNEITQDNEMINSSLEDYAEYGLNI